MNKTLGSILIIISVILIISVIMTIPSLFNNINTIINCRTADCGPFDTSKAISYIIFYLLFAVASVWLLIYSFKQLRKK